MNKLWPFSLINGLPYQHYNVLKTRLILPLSGFNIKKGFEIPIVIMELQSGCLDTSLCKV